MCEFNTKKYIQLLKKLQNYEWKLDNIYHYDNPPCELYSFLVEEIDRLSKESYPVPILLQLYYLREISFLINEIYRVDPESVDNVINLLKKIRNNIIEFLTTTARRI